MPYGFNKEKYREDLGIKQEDIMLISAGDLIKRKNYDGQNPGWGGGFIQTLPPQEKDQSQCG